MKKIKLLSIVLITIIVLITMIVTPIVCFDNNNRAELVFRRTTGYDWTKEYVNEIVECEGYELYVYTSVNADGVTTIPEACDIKVITFYLENDVVTYLVWHKDNINHELGYDIDWEVH